MHIFKSILVNEDKIIIIALFIFMLMKVKLKVWCNSTVFTVIALKESLTQMSE